MYPSGWIGIIFMALEKHKTKPNQFKPNQTTPLLGNLGTTVTEENQR